MAAHPPPVPKDQQAAHGGDRARVNDPAPSPSRTRDTNTAEQGAPGNIHENTTNQGYQQDR